MIENRHAKEDEEASIEDQQIPVSKKQSKPQPARKISKIVGVKKSLPAESQRQLRPKKQPEPVQVKDQDMEESQARRSSSTTKKVRTKKSEPVAGKKRRRGGSEESDSSDDGEDILDQLIGGY